MSERDERKLTAEAERARESLREGVPRPDPALRERLKQEFVSGKIAERGRRAPVPEEDPRGIRALGRPWYARPAFLVPAVGAAAAVVFVTISFLNLGPEWRVAGAKGEGSVQIEGEPIPIGDLGALQSRIRPGVQIGVPEGSELDLVSKGLLAIQVTAGSDVTLPPPPARWLGRDMELHARQGELRITTGPGFRGARLSVHTPDAVVEVTGTTLAVILEPTGTCVCVLEGRVKLARRGVGAMDVPAGMRGYAFRDRRAPEMDEMRSMERTKLAMFRDADPTAH